MPFKKGNQYGATSKRGKDKVKQKVKEYLASFIDGYLDESFVKDFNELQPKERVKVISDFLPYIMPKMSSTDINLGDTDGTIQLVHKDADSKK